MRRREALCFCALLLMSVMAAAQNAATPNDKIGLDIAVVPSTSQDAATAQAYTWKAYLDGSATAIVLPGAMCSGTNPATCQFPIPATFPAGQHTMTISASNVAGEGQKSAQFSFVLTRQPNAPTTIRIIVVP